MPEDKEDITTFVEDKTDIKKFFREGIQSNPKLQEETAQALNQVKPGDQILLEPQGIKIIPNNDAKPEHNTSKENAP